MVFTSKYGAFLQVFPKKTVLGMAVLNMTCNLCLFPGEQPSNLQDFVIFARHAISMFTSTKVGKCPN